MERNRTYHKLLDAFQKPGCPICHFILEDSRGYLDGLMYERILDVPTRLELMDSFGFCSWHAWQIPSLPAICSPATGYAILASDLLRKLDLVTHARLKKSRRNSAWKIPFRKLYQSLFYLMKSKPCPVCVRIDQFESYYFKDLVEFIQDEAFLSAYRASDGICLPHFFGMEQSFSDHPNFPTLVKLQLSKVQALRAVLEEYIRKQDHRFQDQITSDEAKAWRVALELLVGKPGVFANEMQHELWRRSSKERISDDELTMTRPAVKKLTLNQVIDDAKTETAITLYIRRPLPSPLLDGLKKLASGNTGHTIEVVVEEFHDVEYLWSLYRAGFSLFYGLGLPSQSVIFLGRNQGFLLGGDQGGTGENIRPLKKTTDVYFKLLWRRFGNAVSLSGQVKEKDLETGLFRLLIKGGRERWCRFRSAAKAEIPPLGAMVEVFGWEKWGTQVLEVLDLSVREKHDAGAQ